MLVVLLSRIVSAWLGLCRHCSALPARKNPCNQVLKASSTSTSWRWSLGHHDDVVTMYPYTLQEGPPCTVYAPIEATQCLRWGVSNPWL
ncbi:hypothetical protein D3C84_1040710 [compost metagenome]